MFYCLKVVTKMSSSVGTGFVCHRVFSVMISKTAKMGAMRLVVKLVSVFCYSLPLKIPPTLMIYLGCLFLSILHKPLNNEP